MAFADPQTVTISAVPVTLARTGSGADKGAFRKDDGSYSLRVEHAYGKRARRFIRLDNRRVSADPLAPANNVLNNMGVHLVVDAPLTGYTNVELKAVIDGFLAYLTASSGAAITKLLGGES